MNKPTALEHKMLPFRIPVRLQMLRIDVLHAVEEEHARIYTTSCVVKETIRTRMLFLLCSLVSTCRQHLLL